MTIEPLWRAMPPVVNLEAYVQALQWLTELPSNESLVLDFSESERVYPDGVLPLIATLSRLREQRGISVDIRVPRDRRLRGVFQAVGWEHYLVGPRTDFPKLPARMPRFTPVRLFHDTAELDLLHRKMIQVLVSQARLATWLPEALQWALWEVMENVLNHAEVRFGWVQASSYPERKHINLLVVDAGIGIRRSLSQRFPNLSDEEALRQAVEKGVTRDPAVGAGYGLAGCREIIRMNKGEMTVYSGAVLLRQELKVKGWGASRTEEELLRYGKRVNAHVGTIVELELRIDRPVDLAAALGQRRPSSLLELDHDTGSNFEFMSEPRQRISERARRGANSETRS